MWDLALFGRQDTRRQVDTSTPIDEQRVRWWFKRMGLTIKAVQEAWPGVPIWIRVIHRVGELPSLSSGALLFFSRFCTHTHTQSSGLMWLTCSIVR